MRKPTRESREWNRIHEYKLNKRKYKRRYRSGVSSSTVQYRYRRSGLSGPRTRILCPEILSLEDNFDEVVGLLAVIRDQSLWGQRLYIDFRPIRQVTPSGALVLAAELDRVNHLDKRLPLRAVDADKWDPNVRRLLKEMGFFKLLRVTSSMVDQPTVSDDRYIGFRSGERVDGEIVDELRRLYLDPHVAVPKKRLLYDAITEAMANVRQHAYGDRRPYTNAPNHWWLSASFNAGRQEITVMIYDQGRGIPETLPQTWAESIQGLTTDNHAQLIEAAHNLSRSSTRERHRGSGFARDIRHYIERLDKDFGTYNVISGRGEYIVESGDGNTTTRSFDKCLEGTFVQWRIHLL